MLNPNRDPLTSYPPEIGALLEGRPLGAFSRKTPDEEEQVGVCLLSVLTDALVLALRGQYEREPSVRRYPNCAITASSSTALESQG